MRRRVAFAADDRALAAVVTFVLLLAVAVSYFAFVVHTDVPRWGLENDRAWDSQVSQAMAQMAQEAENAQRAGTSAAVLVPRPPAPDGLDIPLLGRAQPLAPQGTLTFAPAGACAGAQVVQQPAGGAARTDVSAGGCLSMDAAPAYASGFGYHYENGALLRVQNGEAAIVREPPISVRPLEGPDGVVARLDVTLRLEELTGAAFSTSLERTEAHVSLGAERALPPREMPTNNSHRVDLVFSTQHAEAWERWLLGKVETWGLNAVDACPDGGCASVTRAAGSVTLSLHGPRAQDDTNDLSVTVAKGRLLVQRR